MIRRMVDSPAPPETLHHYTTAAGLLGIVEPVRLGALSERSPDMQSVSRTRSIALWATDARFLNDSAELRYAARALADKIEALIPSSDPIDDETTTRIGTVAARLRAGEFIGEGFEEGAVHTAYVTSFCQEGDLLSQWRGYGSSGGGYSVEFRTESLRELNSPFGQAGNDEVGYLGGSILQQVVYGMDEEALDSAAKKLVHPDQYIPSMTAAVSELARFKDPAFSEENEWRLIPAAGTYAMACRYRASPTGAIVPYIQLHRFHWDQPHDAFTSASAIKSITVRPGPDTAIWRDSLLQLMQQRGFRDVEVHTSAIPFRS